MKASIPTLFVLAGVLLLPGMVLAAVPDTYTNDNFRTSTHEAPAEFGHDPAGNVYGTTVSGRAFSQIVLDDPFGVRMHKFQIDEAYFYVTDRGVIYADTTLAAVSIYFSRLS